MTPRLAVLLAGVTMAAMPAVAPRLSSLAARASFLPPDAPTVVLDRDVTHQFGFANPVVWVLEAREGTIWTTPRLRRLVALTDDVLRIPGVVAPDVIGLASPNMRDLRITENGFEQTYLMDEVPDTPDDIAALRRRVDTDPAFAGTLVTRDGRAAMVVADFATAADARAVGSAALAVRDRYRDADTAAWVTGAPVLAAALPAASTAVLPRVVLCAGLALALFVAVLGPGAAGAVSIAAVLALAWMADGAVLAGVGLVSALVASLPAALVAAAIAVTGGAFPVALTAVLVTGALGAALVGDTPARAFWLAMGAAAPLAVTAGWLARRGVARMPAGEALARRTRATAAALALALAVGATRLDLSLGSVGYAGRYLPPAAAADVAAVQRLFPPPTSLVLRVRGQPGSVAAPDVLRALDGVATAARADPAVRSAMSVADVVKQVNGAFEGGRPESFAIPDDGVVASRALALAYSPPLRRFVDRSFAEAALWVLVNGDRPADLARVVARMDAALAAWPRRGPTVDPPAGDGALVLLMAASARRIAAGAIVALVVVAAAAGAARGRGAAGRALAAGMAAGVVGAGILGWTWQSLDLVSLPLVAATAVATAALAGLLAPPPRFALGLAVAALPAAAFPAGPLAAALLAGPGLGLLVCGPDGADARTRG